MTYVLVTIFVSFIAALVVIAIRLGNTTGKLEQKIEQKEAEINATVKEASKLVNHPRTDADVISLLDKHIARAHRRAKPK